MRREARKTFCSLKNLLVLFVFISLGISVHLGYWDRLDTLVTEFIQGFASQGLDYFFAFYGYLGSPEFTGLASVLITLWLWRRVSFDAAVIFGLSIALVTFIELAGKFFVFNPGPYDQYNRWPWDSYRGITVDTPYSFPSGHTLRTFFLLAFSFQMLALNDCLKRVLRVSVALLILLMVIERVYIGDHWVSDVAGGILLGYLGYSWARVSLAAK